jgi:hypothetical protein
MGPCRIGLADSLLHVGACVLQLDIVAFASLAQIYFIDKEVQYSLRDYMQESCPNLVGHVNRMKEMYVTHIMLGDSHRAT